MVDMNVKPRFFNKSSLKCEKSYFRILNPDTSDYSELNFPSILNPIGVRYNQNLSVVVVINCRTRNGMGIPMRAHI